MVADQHRPSLNLPYST